MINWYVEKKIETLSPRTSHDSNEHRTEHSSQACDEERPNAECIAPRHAVSTIAFRIPRQHMTRATGKNDEMVGASWGTAMPSPLGACLGVDLEPPGPS